MIGLALDDVAVDCCITKAPCGGEVAGRSPVDRGKQGLKRSVAVDAAGIPLATIAARPTGTIALLEPASRCLGLGSGSRRRSTWIGGTTPGRRGSGWPPAA